MKKELEFQIIDESDITDPTDRAIRESLMISFPNESDREHFSRQRWWHSHHHGLSRL